MSEELPTHDEESLAEAFALRASLDRALGHSATEEEARLRLELLARGESLLTTLCLGLS